MKVLHFIIELADIFLGTAISLKGEKITLD